MQPGTNAHRQGRLLYITGLGMWVCSQPTQQRCAGSQELKGEPAAAHSPSLAKAMDSKRRACLRPPAVPPSWTEQRGKLLYQSAVFSASK